MFVNSELDKMGGLIEYKQEEMAKLEDHGRRKGVVRQKRREIEDIEERISKKGTNTAGAGNQGEIDHSGQSAHHGEPETLIKAHICIDQYMSVRSLQSSRVPKQK
jgi:hypothetical protein